MKRNGAELPDVDMSDYVSVPIFSRMVSQNPFFLYLDNPLCKGRSVTITFSDKDKKDPRTYETYKIIKDNYKTSEFTSKSPEFPWLMIYPNDGSEVTNKFFLEVIEFIRSNLPGTLTQALARKKVNESVWGDIRKKSLGQEERIEEGTNIKSMQPVDIGFSVLWADRDLEQQGKDIFTVAEVKELIADSEWRLPTEKETREITGPGDPEPDGWSFSKGDQKLLFKKRYYKGTNAEVYIGWTSDTVTTDGGTCVYMLDGRNEFGVAAISPPDRYYSARLVKDRK